MDREQRKNDIRKWFDSPEPDYDAGLALYMKYGRNAHLKQRLTTKRDLRKLQYELSKMVPGMVTDNSKTVTPKNPHSDTNPPVFGDNTSNSEWCEVLTEKPQERLKIALDGKMKFDELPPEVQAVYKDAINIYREMRSAHEKMKLATTDGDRKRHRDDLTALESSRKEKWKLIDEWAATGKLPPEHDPDREKKTDPANEQTDYKAVNASRSSLTRNLALLEKSTDADKSETYRAKINEALEVITTAGGKVERLEERLRAQGFLS